MVLVSRTNCGHSKCKIKCIGEFHNKETKWFSRRRWEVNIEINALNYFFFLLCPSSGILKATEHNVLEAGTVSVLGLVGRRLFWTND
jgi:hypothetical protein